MFEVFMLKRRFKEHMVISFSLSIIIFAALVMGVYFSTTARKQETVKKQGLAIAKMNISLGIMLISIAVLQFFFYESTTVRIIVACVFMLLGLVNVYGGIKNYKAFAKLAD